MTERIVLYGGSFNPPGRHHERIVEHLCNAFSQTVIIPCGATRTDKAIQISDVHRARLCDLAFRHFSRMRLDNDDLFQGTFRRLVDINAQYAAINTEVWHVIGSDLTSAGSDGLSVIQREWKDGQRAWNSFCFVVLERPGYPLGHLPPHYQILSGRNIEGASSEIRERIRTRQQFEHLVSPSVAEYIRNHNLYCREGE